ncbi:MAG: PAS domain S-box protein [Roseiarcus sp.]
MTDIVPQSADPQDLARKRLATLERRFAVTPAMLHSINAEGRLIAVSDAWLTHVGYTREEALGRFSLDFLTPESRARAHATVVPEFYRRGRVDDVEYQMVCKDGRVIDILLSAVLEHDEAQGDAASIAVITDVTARKAAERLLAESEARYRGLVEDQSELVSLATPEGELRFVNLAYAQFYGLRPEAMIGRNLFEFIPEAARGEVEAHLRAVCASRLSVNGENQVRRPNGEARWVAWTNRAVTDAAGTTTAIHSVGRDIERRVAAEQRLKESETRYRLLADHSSDMVFQLDRDLVRRYVSPACREILGYEPEDLIGVGPVSMVHPEDAATVALRLKRLLDGDAERLSAVNRIRHRDGRWIWVEAQWRALREPGSQLPVGIIGSLRDISARKAVEDQLAEATKRLETLAGQDGLTGLANRRVFDEAFAREYARARREQGRIALIMVDVDRFKQFNDIYGHPEGDECLRRIGKAIKDTIQRPGDLVARYGGEEFAVILPMTDERGAAVVAERIRRAVQDLAIRHAGAAQGVVTISQGVDAAGPRTFDLGRDSLLDNADRALYRAKDVGRNVVMQASSMSRLDGEHSVVVRLR